MMATPLSKRFVAEAVGTAMLLMVVVGSGIMAERLSGGSVALALLANSLATGAGLVTLILAFGSVSGAHFNPAVTAASLATGSLTARECAAYIVAQLVGAFAGVASAHAMFALPAFTASTHERSSSALVWSESVATFGLLGVIFAVSRRRPDATPLAVGLYITSAYWFTGSTSFANPAVTLARAATDTFTGIRLADVAPFVFGQSMGAIAAVLLFGWLVPPAERGAHA